MFNEGFENQKCPIRKKLRALKENVGHLGSKQTTTEICSSLAQNAHVDLA